MLETASERKGNIVKGFKNYNLRVEASMALTLLRVPDLLGSGLPCREYSGQTPEPSALTRDPNLLQDQEGVLKNPPVQGIFSMHVGP